ncbi:MAG: molybdate ABC transporter substrate-binding protein [Cellvibrionaceae bacterium]|nr:molybdate ABC transporter substrate-binding protein [Cellvibrionaceae bacterium]
MTKCIKLLVAVCGLLAVELALAGNVTNVAVASNFSAPMKELVAEFEKQHSGRVRVSYASSGKLFAQINHGAPFDIMLSADEKIPQQLVAKGLADEASRFTYAVGAIVLWAPNNESSITAAQQLLATEFGKLALANPKHAPYGRAALETLERLNLVDSTKTKWVTGENIAQTYHFVSTGNADIGFVARSQLSALELAARESAWLVPVDYYAAIKQDAVLLRRGKHNKLALEFLAFMQSAPALEIIRKYGYDVIETKPDANGNA